MRIVNCAFPGIITFNAKLRGVLLLLYLCLAPSKELMWAAAILLGDESSSFMGLATLFGDALFS